MSFQYKYLPDVAIADTAFEIKGDSWADLFAGATAALTEVMVDLSDLAAEHTHEIELSAATVDELLYDWLSEIVYLKDTEGLLVKSTSVQVSCSTIWQAHGSVTGDILKSGHHRLGQDVKAVTYHLFDVQKTDEGCRATVVLDI